MTKLNNQLNYSRKPNLRSRGRTMENLAWYDLITLLVILFVSSNIAAQLAINGLFETLIQWPVNYKLVKTIIVNIVIIAIYLFCLTFNNIKIEIFPLCFAIVILPVIWSIFYTIKLSDTGLIEYKRASAKFSTIIKNYYLPGQYDPEIAKMLRNSRLIISAKAMYKLSIERQKKGTPTRWFTREIDSSDYEYDSDHNIMINCLNCPSYIKIDHDYPSAIVLTCTTCRQSLAVKRDDKGLLIKYLLDKPTWEITDLNLKNIAIASIELAILCRIIGETTESQQLLIEAESIMLLLLLGNMADYGYNNLLAMATFQMAENEQIRGEYTKARITYNKCIGICEQTNQTRTLEIARMLLNRLP